MTKHYLSNKNWRNKNRKLFNAGKRRNYRRGETNRQNSGEPWTINECNLLTDLNRPSDRALAQELGRTVRAIQIQRSKLKKV